MTAITTKLVKSAKLTVNNLKRPNPSLFIFPGITWKPFWNPDDIPSALKLEKSYDLIKNEFLQAKMNNLLINDYSLSSNENMLHKGEWNWFSYVLKGKRNSKFSEVFPETNRILNSLDDLLVDLPFAYSFFSELKPNSEISPHYGACNLRLRIHLGIDIPNDNDNCFINIEEKSVNWKNGETIVFDDTYIHNVINKTDKTRVILLVDIWHPEIMKEEREAIVNMFNNI